MIFIAKAAMNARLGKAGGHGIGALGVAGVYVSSVFVSMNALPLHCENVSKNFTKKKPEC